MNNNTTVRILVSVLTIPLILGLTILGGYYFLAFVLGIGLLAYFEFVAISQKKEASPFRRLGFISVAAVICNAYFHFLDFQSLIVLVVLSTVLLELFHNKGSAIFNIGTTFLGVLYLGMFLSTLVELREYFQSDYRLGGYLVISLFASIWLCDSAAFFGGISLGKHKLFERVSPKKSWEGAIFGFVFAVIAMLVARWLVLPVFTITDALIIGVIVGTIGQMGDLAESLLKRDAGVKDSSNLIPGHGGVFDRFDSLIAVAPVVYLYLKFFVNAG